MEVLNLIAGHFGGGKTPLPIRRIHTAYIGVSYLHFRYLSEMFGKKYSLQKILREKNTI